MQKKEEIEDQKDHFEQIDQILEESRQETQDTYEGLDLLLTEGIP